MRKMSGFKLAKPYVTHIKQDEKEVENFEKHVLPAALKKNESLKQGDWKFSFFLRTRNTSGSIILHSASFALRAKSRE